MRLTKIEALVSVLAAKRNVFFCLFSLLINKINTASFMTPCEYYYSSRFVGSGFWVPEVGSLWCPHCCFFDRASAVPIIEGANHLYHTVRN